MSGKQSIPQMIPAKWRPFVALAIALCCASISLLFLSSCTTRPAFDPESCSDLYHSYTVMYDPQQLRTGTGQVIMSYSDSNPVLSAQVTKRLEEKVLIPVSFEYSSAEPVMRVVPDSFLTATRLILTDIDFQNLTMIEAIKRLNEEIQRQHPNENGLHICYRGGPGNSYPLITIRKTEASVSEIIEEICRITKTFEGCEYSGHLVLLAQYYLCQGDTAQYLINPHKAQQLFGRAEQKAAKRWFKEQTGTADHSDLSNLLYWPESCSLWIKSSKTSLRKIDSLLSVQYTRDTTASPSLSPATSETIQLLQNTTISQQEFDNSPVEEICTIIADTIKKERGKTIHFVFHYLKLPGNTNGPIARKRITLYAEELTALRLARMICRFAECHYEIIGNTIHFAGLEDAIHPHQTRTYTVLQVAPDAPKEYLSQRGIRFYKGSKAEFSKGGKTLTVTVTEPQIPRLEKLLPPLCGYRTVFACKKNSAAVAKLASLSNSTSVCMSGEVVFETIGIDGLSYPQPLFIIEDITVIE